MISPRIICDIEKLKEEKKVDFLLNYSIRQDEDWSLMSNKNNQISLNVATAFSGIGSPEYALKRLEIKHSIKFAGDIDEYCKKTYLANYPLREQFWHEDVRNFSAKQFYGDIDLFVGGSPCQSFSIGGKRLGFEESRGTLFYDYARLVKECSPKVFIYENVTGLMNHDGGHTWDVVKATFDELGYKWVPWVLNSKNYGIPQNRKRVYVVGFRSDLALFFNSLVEPIETKLVYEVEDILQEFVPNKYYLPIKGFLRVVDPKHLRHVALNGKIARTQIANQQYNWYGDIRIENDIPKRLEDDDRVHKGIFKGERVVSRCLTPRECLRLMGYDDRFNIVVDDFHMYKECGNSIVVNVMMEIIKSIIKTGVFYVG